MADDVWRPNPLRKPRRPDVLVICKYRNGVISPPVLTGQRRWEPWPFGETEWDVEFFKLVSD
jgi:hypothetical protein